MKTNNFNLDPQKTLALRDKLLADGSIKQHYDYTTMFEIVGTQWLVTIQADQYTNNKGFISFSLRSCARTYDELPDYKDKKKKAEVELIKSLFGELLNEADAEKTFTVHIKLNDKVLYNVDVVARNEVEAMEFAYDMMEYDTYAEVQ